MNLRLRKGSWPGLALALTIVTALGATLIHAPRPLLVWNGSASSPPGLYLVSSAAAIQRGDMVLAWAPGSARELAARRGYLPRNVPLVKMAGAAAGDRACARGPGLWVNGQQVALRRRWDGRGRQLPWWSGCRTLVRGELLLLSANRPLAFDGRYFGLTRSDQVLGRARLLWAR